jgi:predicted permease
LLGTAQPFSFLASTLRYSARSFARTPLITVALVATIAVGVGSNAAVQGFNRGLIARDMPSVETEGVVSVFAREENGEVAPLSADELASLRRRTDVFEWLGAAREFQGNVEVEGREDVMSIAAVTSPAARLLGLSLEGGAIISHQLWETAFQGRADVRGEHIRIDGHETRIAGVAPAWLNGLYLGHDVDVWVALPNDSLLGATDRSRTLWGIARMRSGTSLRAARVILREAKDPHLPDRGASAGTTKVRVGSDNIGMAEYTGVSPEVADGLARVHTLLGLAAATVFLIVCANVASFLLARASARSRETSVRIALGARRVQLVAQLLSDAVIIAAAGTAFGLLLAFWTSRVVPALLFEADARYLVFVPDTLGIVGAALVCAAVTIACGLTPLLEVRHDRPAVVLRRESMGPSVGTSRLRAALVVGEMTACCVLVISTGLLLQSFRGAVQTRVGRKFSHSILATVPSMPGALDPLEYLDDIEKAAKTVTARSPLAWVARPPGSHPTWRSFRVETPGTVLRDVTMDVEAFTPETLEQIALPPTAGRLFGVRDGPQSCRVAVLNEAAASELFGGDALGRSVEDAAGKRVEIIGVVAPRSNASPARPAGPTIYYYPDQTPLPLGRRGPARFRVRASGGPVTAILNSNIVSRSYFDGTGSSRVAGRSFPRGPVPGGCRVGVINREAADQYYGGNAVGGAVIDPLGARTEIIGVMSEPALGAFERHSEPSIFFPMRQDAVHRMTLVIDAEMDNAALDTLRQRLESVPGKANGPVVVERLEEHLARTSLAPLHIATLLVRVSAVLALLLAVVGVYGALTDAVERRRREVAVRIALGAQSWRVIAMVLGEGSRLAALGAGAGIAIAAGVKYLLERFAPATPIAVETWVAGPALLLAVVVVASAIPAFRALSVSPVRVLREDG